MTDDLVQWLGEQLDEDERIARAATAGPWTQSGIGEYGWGVAFSVPGAGVEANDSDQGRADADFIAAQDPARVLREIDAKRELLVWLVRKDDWALDNDLWTWDSDDALLLLALPYADRPGYREEWKP
ncbi:DUF6221 family protein [Streptomyces sp. NPDC088785]|uniref:DUF6221 family protein n=1 Tax=Streptomyces sp. NPDC088785 TaxID=3365897 RepID=UPI003807169B